MQVYFFVPLHRVLTHLRGAGGAPPGAAPVFLFPSAANTQCPLRPSLSSCARCFPHRPIPSHTPPPHSFPHPAAAIITPPPQPQLPQAHSRNYPKPVTVITSARLLFHPHSSLHVPLFSLHISHSTKKTFKNIWIIQK